ncbi:MAG: peptidoglycan DD-metalloendopeptidase family protein [Elusimicrobiota bacterium]
MNTLIKLSLIIICICLTTGCSTKKPVSSVYSLKTPPQIKPTINGFYHSVKKGETLWRISQIYSINIERLAEINKISNTCKIENGQKIFIPDSFQDTKNIKQPLNQTTSFVWPYRGDLSSCFNQIKKNVNNLGIDIIAKPGASIGAAEAGNVVFTSANMRGYGKTIIIVHNENFSTIYANNQKNLVKTGDYVQQGQTIAYAGSTGRTSGCVVHFELRKNNKAQNPLLYLP